MLSSGALRHHLCKGLRLSVCLCVCLSLSEPVSQSVCHSCWQVVSTSIVLALVAYWIQGQCNSMTRLLTEPEYQAYPL